MKIIAASDFHGTLLDYQWECDVFCICGDTFPLRIQWKKKKCEYWLRQEFIPWTNKLKCKHVLLIAGNHDFYFEKTLIDDIHLIFKGTKITYLENDSINIDGVTFYGTPYCHQFGEWAFMRDDERLKIIFQNIPEHVDILLSHDAPYGVSDICFEYAPWNSGSHLGCQPLREEVERAQPKYLLHGHLHSSNHEEELLGETKVRCVSLLDEKYEPAYEYFTLEYDKH